MARGKSASRMSNKPRSEIRQVRAFKPKVRTGCGTWKRRIKCGEEKPICLRCSVGEYICDGYDDPTELVQETTQKPSLAQVHFELSQLCQGLKPLAADIQGPRTERQFFHSFRIAATTDAISDLECPFVLFFGRICPQISHQQDAVKHAMVALGSTYQLMQVSDSPIARAGVAAAGQLDIFTIEQYSKAMSQLQKYTAQSSQDRILLILVCCLSFTCLEIMRQNRTAAHTHLVNGLNIIASLPLSMLCFLNEPSSITTANINNELQEVIKIFTKLEMFNCFFSPNFYPAVAAKVYQLRRLYTGPDPAAILTFSEGHFHAINCFRDVVTRLSETSFDTSGAEFWSQPSQQHQQLALVDRARKLTTLLKTLINSPTAPKSGSTEFFSMHLDTLHICCAKILLRTMEIHDVAFMKRILSTTPSVNSLRQELRTIVDVIWPHSTSITTKKLNFRFAHNADIVAILFFLASKLRNSTVSDKAGCILHRVNNIHGGLWDDRVFYELLDIALEGIS